MGGVKYEIIFVNDGSTDQTLSLIEEEARKYTNYKYISIAHSGPSTARNVGLQLAEGDWIFFYDADDYLNADIVKVALAKATEFDVDALQFHFKVTNEDGSKSWVGRNGTKKAGVYEKKEILKEVLPNIIGYSIQKVSEYGTPSFGADEEFGSVWRFLYKRSFLEEYGLKFDPRVNNSEDRFFNCNVMICARRIRFIDDVLYTYVTKQNGTMYTNLHNSERLIRNKTNAAIIRNEIHERCLKENGVDISNMYAGSMFFSVLELCKSFASVRVKDSYPHVIAYLRIPYVQEAIAKIPLKGSLQIKILLVLVKHKILRPILMLFRLLNLINKIFNAKHTH